MNNERLYKAFISYRHMEPDKAIAARLQKELESFRVPPYLVKQGYPSRLGLVFRDETELPTSSDLTRQIEEALERSEYLIVICSPRTHLSKYVRAEIEYFKKLKGDDRCLALLIEGDPADESQQVFPDELKKSYHATNAGMVSEPIAADVRAIDLRASFRRLKREKLRIIAGLLRCNFDELVRRERERKLQFRIWIVGAAAVFSFAFGLFTLWQLNLVQVSRKESMLSFSAQSLLSGDHVTALQQAQAALSVRTGSTEGSGDTSDALFLAQVIPAFSPYTQISGDGQITKSFFTPDSKRVVVLSNIREKVYSLDAELLSTFSVEGKGQRIVDVNLGGTRIVVSKTDPTGVEPAVISLYDAQRDQKIVDLATSKHYSVQDLMKMNLDSVLSAQFSSDGRLVTGYRSGGYFNENETVIIYDAQTGKRLAQIDGDLLGTQVEAPQGRIISQCRFLPDNTLFLQGSKRFVYYNLAWSGPLSVDINETPLAGKEYIALSDDRRFGVYEDDKGCTWLRDRAAKKTCLLSTEDNTKPDLDQMVFAAKRLLIRMVTVEQNKDVCTGILMVDLEKMDRVKNVLFSGFGFDCFEDAQIVSLEGCATAYVVCRSEYARVADALVAQRANVVVSINLNTNDANMAADVGLLSEGNWAYHLLSAKDQLTLMLQRLDTEGKMLALQFGENGAMLTDVNYIRHGEEFDARTAVLSSDAQYLLFNRDNGVMIYAAANHPAVQWSKASNGLFSAARTAQVCAVQSPNGKQLLIRKDTQVASIDLENELTDLMICDDGTALLSLDAVNMVCIWDTASQTPNCQVDFGAKELGEIMFSSTGDRFAVLVDGQVVLYDARSGKEIKELHPTADTNTDRVLYSWYQKLVFSPDGSKICAIVREYPQGSSQFSKRVAIWNADNGESIGSILSSYLDSPNGKAFSAADYPPSYDSVFFSEDGSLLGTTFAQFVMLWDLKTGARIASLKEEGVPANRSPVILAQQNLMLYLNEQTLNVWDFKRGERKFVVDIDGGIYDFQTSPEARWLLCTGTDGVYIYDLLTGKLRTKLLNSPALRLTWMGDEKIVYTLPLVDRVECIAYPYK